MIEPSPADYSNPQRLEFLQVLGLIPPVSEEDVKQAYLDKAKTAHPDRGGDPQQFIRLQEAFEQATEYARFKAGRMQWLSRWVEQYAEQQHVIDQIKAWGGEVQVNSCDWLTQSIGPDFAAVLDKVNGIRLSGPKVDDGMILQLATERRLLAGLRKLELIDTAITSVGLRQLHGFETLRHLDLSGTKVSVQALESLIAALRQLETLVLQNTGLGWWARTRLKMSNRDLEIL